MKILFVCMANIGRSQMAEAFFADFAPNHKVSSAGTHVRPEREGKPISIVTDKVTKCMAELGYDVDNKIMNQLTPEMVEDADKVVAITAKESLPDYLQDSPKLEVWDIEDPGGTDYAFHIKIRDIIKKRVEGLVKELSG